MKFGKKIRQAAEASVCLCDQNKWLDYKGLKKMLKEYRRSVDHESSKNDQERSQIRSENSSLQANTFCRLFFTKLRKEMLKVSTTFSQLERPLLDQFRSTIWYLRTCQRMGGKSQISTTDLDLLLHVYSQMLFLRNYALLNFMGFSKILKKHDKVSGFGTRAKFLLNAVSSQSFSDHKDLQAALAYLTEKLENIKRHGTFSEDFTKSAQSTIT